MRVIKSILEDSHVLSGTCDHVTLVFNIHLIEHVSWSARPNQTGEVNPVLLRHPGKRKAHIGVIEDIMSKENVIFLLVRE